jgi:transposase InsO family protein
LYEEAVNPESAKDFVRYRGNVTWLSIMNVELGAKRQSGSDFCMSKRDYVHVSPCPDAQTVMHQLSAWINHYNEVHPHKALGYRSPREFIAAHV